MSMNFLHGIFKNDHSSTDNLSTRLGVPYLIAFQRCLKKFRIFWGIAFDGKRYLSRTSDGFPNIRENIADDSYLTNHSNTDKIPLLEETAGLRWWSLYSVGRGLYLVWNWFILQRAQLLHYRWEWVLGRTTLWAFPPVPTRKFPWIWNHILAGRERFPVGLQHSFFSRTIKQCRRLGHRFPNSNFSKIIKFVENNEIHHV